MRMDDLGQDRQWHTLTQCQSLIVPVMLSSDQSGVRSPKCLFWGRV
jgi:hypothetical protein